MNMHKTEARTWVSHHFVCMCVCTREHTCKEPQLVFVGWFVGHWCKNHSEYYNQTPTFFVIILIYA